MKKCPECFNMFEERSQSQICCSAECTRLRNYKKVMNNYISSDRMQLKAKTCSICGKMINPNIEGAKARLHEACVMRDLIDTVRSGKKLTGVQYQRLMLKGMRMPDLMEMVKEEIKKEKKEKRAKRKI